MLAWAALMFALASCQTGVGDPASVLGVGTSGNGPVLYFRLCPDELVSGIEADEIKGGKFVTVWQVTASQGQRLSSPVAIGHSPQGFRAVRPLTEPLGDSEISFQVSTSSRSIGELLNLGKAKQGQVWDGTKLWSEDQFARKKPQGCS